MSVKQFKLPDPGEGLVEAEIVTWKVKPGDEVKVNDVVVEIETAKSLVELPIPWAGTVAELLVAEGTTVEVGTPIIGITVTGGADEPSAPSAGAATAGDPGGAEPEERVANLVGYGPKATTGKRRARKGGATAQGQSAPARVAVTDPVVTATPTAAPPVAAPPVAASPDGHQTRAAAGPALSGGVGDSGGRPLAKPPVRKYAKDNGVDLALVTPTSDRGIISRADVDEYLTRGGVDGAEAETGSGSTAYQAPSFERSGEREVRTPIKGVRKVTAQAMVGSAFSAPHVTEFITVDVTRTMRLVERLKSDREFRDVKVSPLLVVAKALVLAVRRNPGVNATWDEAAGEIIQKNYVNLGIAASTPRGLIVPNIKDADQLSLRQLADAMADLVATARAGRTQPAAQSAGTITITNVGVFGVDNGTPIINPGEAAILCFGAIRKMPWVVTGKDGSDRIKPRWVTQLSLAFDHRLVDGDLGSRFLADVAAVLEDPSRGLVWG